jgi:hypothetical protein
MSNHKTPYEIRLNLLELAQRIESDRMAAESRHASDKDIVTQAPSVKDVVDAAEKLNGFVSKPNS